MAKCKFCVLAVKIGFALFFAARGYQLLTRPDDFKPLFRAQYARFEAGLRALSGRELPAVLRASSLARHTSEALLGYGWALTTAALLSPLYSFGAALAGALHLLEAVIAHDGIGLLRGGGTLRAFQPLLEAVALLLGGIAIGMPTKP